MYVFHQFLLYGGSSQRIPYGLGPTTTAARLLAT